MVGTLYSILQMSASFHVSINNWHLKLEAGALETPDSVSELRMKQFDSDSGSSRLGSRSNTVMHTSNLSVQDGVLGPLLFLLISLLQLEASVQCKYLCYVFCSVGVEKQCRV